MMRRPFAVAVILASALGSLIIAAPDAHAAARVSATSPAGSARANASGATTLTVKGTGFQSIPKAMGGIYVLFGTVDDPGGGSWRPSRGGASGQTFRYMPDSETKNNQGRQRFVAFPGSQTEEAANGGELHADGGWSTTLNLPGPVISVVGRSGGTEQIDCRTVTCGVITVGAHGIKNANNETFTAVSFAAASGTAGSASGAGSSGSAGSSHSAAGAGGAGGAAAGSTVGAGNGASGEAPPPGEVVVGVDEATALAGRVMSFTARGFVPGEQVTVVLGDGRAAVGPLVAGAQGEIAGVIQLPRDLRLGTHTLQVTGAASGLLAQAAFTVGNPADAPAPTPAPASGAAGAEVPWAWIALGVAAAALLAVVVLGLLGRRRPRRAGSAQTAAAGAFAPQRPPLPEELTPEQIDALLEEARRAGFADVGSTEAGSAEITPPLQVGEWAEATRR